MMVFKPTRTFLCFVRSFGRLFWWLSYEREKLKYISNEYVSDDPKLLDSETFVFRNILYRLVL